MMSVRVPINTELQHLAPGYDPAKAHEYYMRVRELKGRQKGADTVKSHVRTAQMPSPKAQQKVALQNSIQNLEGKLVKLERLIAEKEAILRKDQTQAKAKAHQQKDKPKTAADKAKAARGSKKYKQKHRQELKTKAKRAAAKSGGGSSKSGASNKPSDMSIANLKALATKVKGQIAVAKQKLAAL
jgi:hypothetical protein